MSTDDWLGPLGEAYHTPRVAAERWRSGGVVGVYGASAPRELVLAAGMLPVRLDPLRLGRPAASQLPGGLGTDLVGGALALLAALIGGELEWLDCLLIGRDSEANTKLFYLIREMAEDPEFSPRIPRFAFSDVLRLPHRSSAAYNRVRLRQLAETVASWAGRQVDPAAIEAAIGADDQTRRSLRELRVLQQRGLLTARDRLVAERGAQALPTDAAHAAVRAAVSSVQGREAIPAAAAARVFISGSEPQPETVGELEALGLRVVGDDHDWAIADLCSPAATGDPIDRLADHYQFNSPGAARAGLDRVSRSVGRVREVNAQAVLQVSLPGDEASGWELPELRRHLPDLPVVSVALDQSGDNAALRHAAETLLGQVNATASPTVLTDSERPHV